MNKQKRYMAPSVTVVEMETETMLALSIPGFSRDLEDDDDEGGEEFNSIGTWRSDIWDDEEEDI